MDFPWKSGGNLRITRNNIHSLILERSKWGAFFHIALCVIALIILGFVNFPESATNHNDNNINPIKIIVLILALAWVLPHIIMSFRTIIKGDTFKFQKKRARILKNNKPWFKFRETTGVLIKHKYDAEKEQYSYELYLISVGGHQYWLDESSHLEELTIIAELIGETLGVRVSATFD